MDQKIEWMLGMSENMMNISMQHTDKPIMGCVYSMTSAMAGNLNHMKSIGCMDKTTIDMMEQMMRNMEGMMQNMDMVNIDQQNILKGMMGYLIGMQLSAIRSGIEMQASTINSMIQE